MYLCKRQLAHSTYSCASMFFHFHKVHIIRYEKIWSAIDIDMTSSVLVKFGQLIVSNTSSMPTTWCFLYHMKRAWVNSIQACPVPLKYTICIWFSINTQILITFFSSFSFDAIKREVRAWKGELVCGARTRKCLMSMHCVSVFERILTSSETLSISMRQFFFMSQTLYSFIKIGYPKLRSISLSHNLSLTTYYTYFSSHLFYLFTFGSLLLYEKMPKHWK